MISDPQKPFLGVERSVRGSVWVDRLDPAAARAAAAIAQRHGLSDILARVVAARGVGVEEVEEFLAPTIRALMPDPSTLADMDALAARLADAIEAGERIALFGDYDVDGACCCALMVRYLRHFGIEPRVHIPDRVFEGYGPSIAAIDALADAGATLIVTLDCGTTSGEALAHARARGADVLVLDHHLAEDALPAATALVNPNRPDDISGLGHLAAAGVTFMALVATSRALRARGRPGPDLMALADLVALATVCDVVPLTGLNRAFVVRGIETIRQGANPGLAALALAARVGGPVTPYHLGYLLGPRINAGGRIGDAALGTRLLATGDEHEALAIAARLDELNTERQRVEKQALDEAVAAAEAELGGTDDGPPVLVLASEGWHAGIVGLVAARLRERFERPAFAIALRPDGTGTGSGRSMPEVDLGHAVIEAVEAGVIARGGGHAMAAGVTLKPGQITPFRAFLAARLGEDVARARARSAVRIDAAMSAGAATVDFAREIGRAGPFGAGNPTPVLAFPAHRVSFADVVGQGHVRFTLRADDGAGLKAIAFRAAGAPLGDALLAARDERPLHLCGTLGLDHWQGRERVQLRAIDAAVPGG